MLCLFFFIYIKAELSRSWVVTLSGLQHRIDSLEESIAAESRHLFKTQLQRLSSLEELIATYDPRNILRQGYAIVRDSSGRAINIDTIEPGSSVSIEISGGELTADVRSKHINTR